MPAPSYFVPRAVQTEFNSSSLVLAVSVPAGVGGSAHKGSCRGGSAPRADEWVTRRRWRPRAHEERIAPLGSSRPSIL